MNRQEEMLVNYTARKSIILADYANKTKLIWLCDYTAWKGRRK